MSTQKGNSQRSRPQKHQNRTTFKNNLHDTSQRTKVINNIQVSAVCQRCKEIIEWKIKYKKYKPLTQPKKCIKCDQKTVKQAYHVMCIDCGKKLGLCTKCVESKDVVQTPPTEQDQLKLDNEMKALLQTLPERKRRTFLRYLNRKDKDEEKEGGEKKREDLMEKLNTLKLADDDDFGFDDNFCYSESEESDLE